MPLRLGGQRPGVWPASVWGEGEGLQGEEWWRRGAEEEERGRHAAAVAVVHTPPSSHSSQFLHPQHHRKTKPLML